MKTIRVIGVPLTPEVPYDERRKGMSWPINALVPIPDWATLLNVSQEVHGDGSMKTEQYVAWYAVEAMSD